jgi:uncharacterized protein
MRLAVLDTNVIISAGIRPDGAPARLMLDWVLPGQVQVVTSPWICAEYREVAARPKFAPYSFPPTWLEFLVEESLLLPEPATWPLAMPDATDAPFLAVAKASGAWLVTGNLKHFPRGARRGVTVVSPAEYLERLATGDDLNS